MPKTSKFTYEARRKLFAIEYVKTGDKKQAAINAGFSKRTAASKANQLLAEPEVREIVDMLLDKASDKVATEAEVLSFITDMMKGKIPDNICDKETGESIEVPCSAAVRLKAAEDLAKVHGLFSERLAIENAKDKEFKIEVVVV